LVIHHAYNTGEIEMAQQGSNGKGQDANVNTSAASPPEDVEPTKLDQPAVEKPAKSPTSTKAPARKTTTKKKSAASAKKPAPKKKAIPKKKAVPKKKPAHAQVAVAVPHSAENKTHSAPEAPGHEPQPAAHAPYKIIHVNKRGSLWPWVILAVMVGIGIYLLNNGMLQYRVIGDKESTASHSDGTLETQVAPSTKSPGEPYAPPSAREGIDRPKSTALDVEQSRPGTVEPSSTRTFGGRIAEESVMPQGTAVVPRSPQTTLIPMDKSSYPPLEPTVPLATEGSLIEPQQAGVEELGSERQTTVTTAAENRAAPSPQSRVQDYAPLPHAEGRVPVLSREHPEADSSYTTPSGERYPPAETNKAGTGNAEEMPVTSGSTAETADNSKANPEVRPRANPRPSSNPSPYWNRPHRPYGPYGTYGRYQTYPPPATRPYPYGGNRFATPRPKDTQ
jgi:hypothetical protein